LVAYIFSHLLERAAASTERVTMSDSMEKQRRLQFPPSLWNSMNIVRPQLKCEEAYYQQLLMPEVPSVVYHFVSDKQRGRHAATETCQTYSRQDNRIRKPVSNTRSKRSERRVESPTQIINSDTDLSPSHPFTSSLRKGIQLDSREAVCLMGLKQKIARLYAESHATNDNEDGDETVKNTKSAKRQAENVHPEDQNPPKRKRGRPPKRKNERTKQSGSKRARSPIGGHTSGRMMASTSKCVDDGLLRDVGEVVQPLRRPRSTKRALLIDESSESDAEKEPVRPVPMNDEELALQLHLDLNAPMLRKRRRSGGLLSPSNSEQ